MTQGRMFHFEVWRDGQKLSEVQLELGQVKIGSHPRSGLFIDDPGVSRVHALVEPTEQGGAVIMDLGSGRGTLVNGQRVNKQALNNGDRIAVGGVEIVYKMLVPQAGGRTRGARAAKVERIPDTVVYSRRYLARPASTDGSLEIAVLARDYVLRDEIYQPPQDFTIGSDTKQVSFAIEDASLGEVFKLVDCSSGQPVLCFKPGTAGELYVGPDRMTLDEAIERGAAKISGGVAQVKLDQDVRARVVFGKIAIYLHRSTRPKVVLPPPRRQYGFYIAIAASFLLHLALLGLIFWYPTDVGSYSSDSFGRNDRWVQLITQEVVEQEPEVPDWLDQDENEETDEGAVTAGEAGRAGDESADDNQARMELGSTEGSSEVSELARSEAREQALNTGALAALNQFGPSNPFGSDASAYADMVSIGGVNDGAIGASYGMGGLAAYGGGLSTGAAVAGGMGYGGGPIALRGSAGGEAGRRLASVSDREQRQVAVRPGNPEVLGQLDREAIQRVINQHRREIVACYERELQRDPNLAGRIEVAFVIDPSGSVARSNIASTTMNSSAVEQCITARVSRWRFPEPRGGGIVRVTYPFNFTAG